MKSIIILIAVVTLVAVGCNKNLGEEHGNMGSHSHKGMNHDSRDHNESTKNMNMKNKDMDKVILGESVKFLNPYFIIQAKLVKDTLPTDSDIKSLELSLLKEIKIDKLDVTKLKNSLKFVKLMYKKDIGSLRLEFYHLSKVLIPMIKKYNLKGVQAYYCPMAKKTWIQNQSKITYNPYIPKKMLHCGSKI